MNLKLLFPILIVLVVCACSIPQPIDVDNTHPESMPMNEFVIGKWVGTNHSEGKTTSYTLEFENSETLILRVKHPGEDWKSLKYQYEFVDHSELAKFMGFEHHYEKETKNYIGDGWLKVENVRLRDDWEVARVGENLLIGFYDVEYF